VSGKKRVFSGVQPSGEAHLGNYMGAFRQWVEMQDEYEAFYCIVDEHAVMGDYDPAELQSRVFDMAVSLYAVGLDPSRSVIFVQSHVHEHPELAWLLNSVAPVGALERMIQYKDKSSRYESVPAGILNYPVLQAADILLYHADLVPVGDDQLQHLELTREIARKWNARFGDYLKEPDALVGGGSRIMGLDGKAKMSKSLGNTVGILDDPDEIWAKVRTAVTDPQRVKLTDPGRPEVCNVFDLHKLITDPEQIPDIDLQCRTAGRGCIDCKRILADSVIELFRPFRARALELRSDPGEVWASLTLGADRARTVASDTLLNVRSRMGMVPPTL